MKRFFAIGFMMVLFSVSLHAADSSLKATLAAPTRVGTATIPAGECKITWVVNGGQAQLTFHSNGQKPITLPAQVVEEKSDTHGVEIDTVKGVQVLESVVLLNMKLVLHPSEGAGN
jgi:hypothetical protein